MRSLGYYIYLKELGHFLNHYPGANLPNFSSAARRRAWGGGKEQIIRPLSFLSSVKSHCFIYQVKTNPEKSEMDLCFYSDISIFETGTNKFISFSPFQEDLPDFFCGLWKRAVK